MRGRARSRDQSGVALIAVLGIVSLLCLLATGALEITRRHGQLMQRSFEAGEVQELLDSALRLTLRDLVALERGTPSDAVRWTPVRNMELFEHRIEVSVESEAGRVDLNFADQNLLLALFAANQVPEEVARVLAARIIDWRDPDDAPLPYGGERAEYQQAGRSLGPRNAPFETVAEVSLVLGAERLSAELLAALTVHSHSEIQQGTVLPSVQRALRWADARQLGGHAWLTEGLPAGAEGLSSQVRGGQAMRVRACLGTPRQTCRTAIVRLTGNAQTPLQVLDWWSSYQPT